MWSRIGKSINLYVLAALVTLIFSACGQSAKATTMRKSIFFLAVFLDKIVRFMYNNCTGKGVILCQ